MPKETIKRCHDDDEEEEEDSSLVVYLTVCGALNYAACKLTFNFLPFCLLLLLFLLLVNHLSTTKREGDAVGRQSKLICINVAKAKQKPTTNQKLPSARCLPPPPPCCCCCIVGQRPRRKFANKKSKLISFAPVAAAAAIKKRCPSSPNKLQLESEVLPLLHSFFLSLSHSLSISFSSTSHHIWLCEWRASRGVKQHRQTSSWLQWKTASVCGQLDAVCPVLSVSISVSFGPCLYHSVYQQL